MITGILLEAKGKSSARYFGNFYIRRTLRIFPLYYATLFLCLYLLPAIPWFSTADLPELRSEQVWLWTYLANFRCAMSEGGVAFGSTRYTFDHFWSLSVEEHFYLFWPVVVFILSKRKLVALAVSIIILVLISRTMWYLSYSPTCSYKSIPLYVLTPFRIDQLLIGSTLATLLRMPRPATFLARHRWGLLRATGVAAVVWFVPAVILRSNLMVQTLGYSLFGAFFVCLINAAVYDLPGGTLRTALEHRALRWFGGLAYGLYVFHPIVLTAAISALLPPAGAESAPTRGYIILIRTLALALSVLLALVSWHAFEKNILRLKTFFE